MTTLVQLTGCATSFFMRAVRSGNVSKVVEMYIDEGTDVEQMGIWLGDSVLTLAVRTINL